MDKDIQYIQYIRTCHPCQIVRKSDRPEPARPTKLPDEPWTEIAIDVCGMFPTGEYEVSLTDYHSRWPEATMLRTITSTKITTMSLQNMDIQQTSRPKIGEKSCQRRFYADRKRRTQEKDFKIGDKVLLRQPTTNKYSTQFSEKPVTIIKNNGYQLEIQHEHGQMYKRNSSHVKKYHHSTEDGEEDDIEHQKNRKTPRPLHQREGKPTTFTFPSRTFNI